MSERPRGPDAPPDGPPASGDDAGGARSFDFPIERGHVIAFARSLGEANGVYYDEAAAVAAGLSSVIAPPTFTQASLRFSPSHPFVLDGSVVPEAPATVDADPGGRDERGTHLHAEQHFEYHRALVVGETLRVVRRAGATWQKEGRRGGVLTFNELITDFLDRDGQVVVTARSVGVTTSRVVDSR